MIERFVEGVGLHDTVGVRRVVAAVKCLVEAMIDAEQVQEPGLEREWEQGGLSSLRQACAGE